MLIMIYRVRKCTINNDGRVTEGTRTTIIPWPMVLRIGGLFFLRPGKLYRVIEEIKPGV